MRTYHSLSRALLFLAALSFPTFGNTQASSAKLDEETDPAAVREQWVAWATKLAEPIFDALDKHELKLKMPVETRATHTSVPVTYGKGSTDTPLEGLSRLLAGIAPWLELGPDETPEGQLRGRLAEAARRAIDAATSPDSPDRMNFSKGRQPVIDAAFLAQATFRAPRELWEKLEPRVQANLMARLKETRHIDPGSGNRLLFSAFVELALARGGEPRDDSRLMPALESVQKWYLGDGTYGDGPHFYWDYYNSYVIQPMLLGILDEVAHESVELRRFQLEALAAAQRYAAVQERLITPDGSFPVTGRSITYRAGALQTLADIALRHELPEAKLVPHVKDPTLVDSHVTGVSPAAARTALTRAIRRTLDAPDTFDEEGWLRIGLAGHQPLLAELYIGTGSLYLCSVALLPLGLPPDDPFWSDPHEPTSWERVWGGASDVWAERGLRRLPAPETPLDVAVRVARWQLTQADDTSQLRHWQHAAFWIGMTELADTDGAPADIGEAVLQVGRDNGWQATGNLLHADPQAITQAYLWTARNGVGKAALAPTIAVFEQLLAEQPRDISALKQGAPGLPWTWCDALFMAPPAMIELSRQTGDMRYRDRALREWWVTTDFLYDPVEKLYYRDKRYFELPDKQGNKQFWARGNGWVFAAMARSLPLLDADGSDAKRMRGVFVEMAERLIELQKADGYWAPSLLSPEGSPPETSGTGFFTYGLAWGINTGLLDRERFEPAVRKGWNALLRAVEPNGKLGYVQKVSASPTAVTKKETHYYGVGALLMAASEITKLDALQPARQ